MRTIGRLDYEGYKSYLEDLMNVVKQDIEKEKEALNHHLANCGFVVKDDKKKDDPSSASVFGEFFADVNKKEINSDEFVLAVGIAHRIYMKKAEFKKLDDEYVYLSSEQGKKAYEGKTGMYKELDMVLNTRGGK